MGYLGSLPATNFETVKKDRYTSITGTGITLSHSVSSVQDIIVWVNSVKQDYTSYSVNGTALTLGGSLVSSDITEVAYIGRTFQTVNPANGSVGTAQLASTSVTAAKLNNDIISGTTALSSEPDDTDEFLVSDAGTLKRIDYSLIKGGGITEADSFRLQSTQAISSGTSTTLTGFARDNESTFGKIGTGLSESSGIFTMGATGIYLLIVNFYLRINGDLTYASLKIEGTTNNSSYVNMAYNDHSIKQVVGNTYAGNTTHAIFDCQDTSNYKFRIGVYGTHTFDCLGSAGDSHTYVTAIRLGDT